MCKPITATRAAGPFRLELRSALRSREDADVTPVKLDRDDDVLVVTINRPEVRNAIDRATADALVAAFGDFDGGRQQFGKAPGAPAREQYVPGIHHAGHGAREQRIVDRDLTALVGLVPFDGGEFGRGPLGVEREHLLLFGVVDEQGGVAADAIQVGLHNAQHRLPGDDGIEGISTGVEHVFRSQGGPRRHRRHGIFRAARQLLHGLVSRLRRTPGGDSAFGPSGRALGLCAERRHGNQRQSECHSTTHSAPFQERLVSQISTSGRWGRTASFPAGVHPPMVPVPPELRR